MGATDADILADPGATPVRFAEKVLGLSLYPWQAKALMALVLASGRSAPLIAQRPAVRTKITVSAPNGAGKDERIISTAALWWLYKHPRGQVVITTTSHLQLVKQTIPSIEAHRLKFEGWQSKQSPTYELTTPTGGSIVGFVTNDAQNVEGWHKKDDVDGPLLYIVNEAKGFKEDKFERIDRCGFNALMYISSPGAKMGRFYDSHESQSAGFYGVRAGYADCPHIPKEKFDDLIAQYGINHPFVRSTLYGEFMSQDDGDLYVCDVDSYDRCVNNPPPHRPGLRVGFCDFGEGMAEHVFGVRDGNKLDIVAAWREPNEEAAAGRFVRLFADSGLKQEQIHGDAAGKPILDLLEKAGWRINRQGFGEPAKNGELYPSWVAEAWQDGAASLKRCEWILPPGDKVLRAQVVSRQKKINARGKLCLEEKHDLDKRGIKSPDRADVVFGLMAARDFSGPLPSVGGPTSFFDRWQAEMDEREPAMAGANAGW